MSKTQHLEIQATTYDGRDDKPHTDEERWEQFVSGVEKLMKEFDIDIWMSRRYSV